jgi:recombination protein U
MHSQAIGQSFENVISFANRQYANAGIALIHKREAPVKVNRKVKGKIIDGHYMEKSTVDYDGVYEGKAIYFEAKSTTKETSFALSNIKPHQLAHLESAAAHGAICFILVHFMAYQKTFYMPLSFLRQCVERARNGGRKSITYSEFEQHCPVVPTTRRAVLDYLIHVDKELKEETA